MGCPIDAVTLSEAADMVGELIASGGPHQHMAINANKVVLMHDDADLRRIVRGCALITADGAAIVHAARFLGQPLPERVTGIDLFTELIRRSPQRQWRPYLLGAREPIVRETALLLRERHSGLDLAGWHHGYFSEEEDPQIVEQIRTSGAHLLFVALPSPRKEKFLDRWLDHLGVPFVMGVGGTFDVVSGHVQRAPEWAQRNSLEWAFRFIQEPQKMWRRNALGSSTFVMRTLAARAGRYRLPLD